jgi:membrane protein implicated in regulation of membrane protease activity
MAIANLLVSAIHLFLVDLAKIDMIYRILAFLFFAFVSIVISVYYVKKLKKKGLVNNVDNAG